MMTLTVGDRQRIVALNNILLQKREAYQKEKERQQSTTQYQEKTSTTRDIKEIVINIKKTLIDS